MDRNKGLFPINLSALLQLLPMNFPSATAIHLPSATIPNFELLRNFPEFFNGTNANQTTDFYRTNIFAAALAAAGAANARGGGLGLEAGGFGLGGGGGEMVGVGVGVGVGGGGRGGPDDVHKKLKKANWTELETETLNEAKRLEFEECKKPGSEVKFAAKAEKWKTISTMLSQAGMERDPIECEGRWHYILKLYRKVKEWNSRAGVENYFRLSSKIRGEHDLPRIFPENLNGQMDKWVGRDDTISSPENPEKDKDIKLTSGETYQVSSGNDSKEEEEFGDVSSRKKRKRMPTGPVIEKDLQMLEKLGAVFEKSFEKTMSHQLERQKALFESANYDIEKMLDRVVSKAVATFSNNVEKMIQDLK